MNANDPGFRLTSDLIVQAYKGYQTRDENELQRLCFSPRAKNETSSALRSPNGLNGKFCYFFVHFYLSVSIAASLGLFEKPKVMLHFLELHC